MSNDDLLKTFECLANRLRAEPPPAVHVAPHVMRRIRTAQTVSERTLAIFAASSFATAVMTAAIGFLLLPEFDNPLAAFLQIVPPIGL